jgi:hypothetical protein
VGVTLRMPRGWVRTSKWNSFPGKETDSGKPRQSNTTTTLDWPACCRDEWGDSRARLAVRDGRLRPLPASAGGAPSHGSSRGSLASIPASAGAP